MNVAYAPGALKKLRLYKERMESLVRSKHLTASEAETLVIAKAEDLIAEAGTDLPVRRPACSQCGTVTAVLGPAQTFRCSCSPEIERSVADGLAKT